MMAARRREALMSPLASRRLLFASFLAALPVPFLSVQPGFAPVVNLLFYGALAAGVALRDPDPMSRLLALLHLGQGLGWALLLYLLARLATRLLRRGGRVRGGLALALVAILLAASLLPIYRTPLSSRGTRSDLLHVLD
jgi:hypothetical protein